MADLTTTNGGALTVIRYILWGGVAIGLGALVFLIAQGPTENPVGEKPKRRAILKGRACRFDMKEGPAISCKGGMLHDPSGRNWPKNSVLCGPVKRLSRAEMDDEARSYLGHTHKASLYMTGDVPRALAKWRYVGDVEQIWYSRTGNRFTGRYFHPFNPKKRVRLYRLGRYCRVELPPGAKLNWRGYIDP